MARPQCDTPLFELRSLLFCSLVPLSGVFPLFIYLFIGHVYICLCLKKRNEDNKNISIKNPTADPSYVV
jgi:hypothetical protein